MTKDNDEKHIYCEIVDVMWDPDGYVLSDSESDSKSWREANKAFALAFNDFKDGIDYEFSDWHYNMKCVFVFLYNISFVNKESLLRMMNLVDFLGDWYISIELDCRDDERLYMYIHLYEGKAIFYRGKYTEKVMQRFGLLEGVNVLPL